MKCQFLTDRAKHSVEIRLRGLKQRTECEDKIVQWPRIEEVVKRRETPAVDFRMRLHCHSHRRFARHRCRGQFSFESCNSVDQPRSEFSFLPPGKLHASLAEHALKHIRNICQTVARNQCVPAVMGKPERSDAGGSSCRK